MKDQSKFSISRNVWKNIVEAVMRWDVHVREMEDINQDIYKIVLDVFTPEKRRYSIFQMCNWIYQMNHQCNMDLKTGQTLLHIIAAKGLSNLCKLLLNIETS